MCVAFSTAIHKIRATMGIFGKSGPPKPVRNLDQELSAVSDRMDRLERKFKDLELDWDSTFEKFAKLHARLAKRARAQLKAEEEGNGEVKKEEPMSPMAQRLLFPYGRR